MTDARNEQLPTWSADLLRQQASIPQHNLPSTSIKDHTNAAISSQRRFHPIYQQGNSHVLSSLAASDPFLSIALHNALQQQHDTITSNQSTNHVAANINHAISSGADIKMILNALASQLGAVLPPTPTPTLPIQLLGTPPDLSVPSRLQQLLSERAIGTTNRVATPPNTIEQPHSAAVLAIAALLLQVGDGRGALTHTSLGTDGSAMSTTSTAHSTYGRDAERTVVGIRQNRTPSPLVGMARPHPTLPILQSIPLLQDPAVLAALPAVLSMTGGGIPQVVQSAPTRHHGIDPSLSLAVRGPLGHIEDKTLPRVLHVPSDDDSLSPYQCLVRRQIELFEASEADIHATAQGRNRPIIVGQVGIRCIHCGRLPIERRARGAVYFPSTLISTYQTAQNMANSHLIKDCLDIPKCIREDLVRIRLRENSESQNTRKSAFGGGRAYWARGLQTNHGVIETEDRRLKFDSSSIVG